MDEYIKSKLNNFPNPIQINNYINNLNLPNKYTIKVIEDLPNNSNINLPDEIKIKI